MAMTPTEIDQLTERIIGCAIEVHKALGSGLLESVYRECMIIELGTAQLRVESEQCVPITYRNRRIKGGLKLDLRVEGLIVVELKAVERLHAGLLMNFNTTAMRSGVRRLNHPDVYAKK